MGYEFRSKLFSTARVVVAVAIALLMAGCAGAAPVAATPTDTSAPSSASVAPVFIPPSPVETSIAAVGGGTLTAAALVPSTKEPTAAPKPATPASSATWAVCSATLGGVAVHVAAQQRTATVVKGKGGSYATLSFWTRDNNACGFVNVFTDTGAWVGANDITNGVTRTQGTNTTPSGTYTMTEAFGLNSSPGSALTYRHVGAGDYWVEDNNSAYYNTYRNVAQGGFNASLPLSDPNGSERLSNYPTQYGYSIVVNFNRAPDTKTPYRGAGIFVHVRSSATAGCISTSSANVVTMLRTMRPGDTITITA
jgi:L,D-peptidoglycan transpeptidase YkuD (ErfK/YbiS/YcfS/YnhG family)